MINLKNSLKNFFSRNFPQNQLEVTSLSSTTNPNSKFAINILYSTIKTKIFSQQPIAVLGKFEKNPAFTRNFLNHNLVFLQFSLSTIQEPGIFQQNTRNFRNCRDTFDLKKVTCIMSSISEKKGNKVTKRTQRLWKRKGSLSRITINPVNLSEPLKEISKEEISSSKRLEEKEAKPETPLLQRRWTRLSRKASGRFLTWSMIDLPASGRFSGLLPKNS
jgi:hypothetical protein